MSYCLLLKRENSKKWEEFLTNCCKEKSKVFNKENNFIKIRKEKSEIQQCKSR